MRKWGWPFPNIAHQLFLQADLCICVAYSMKEDAPSSEADDQNRHYAHYDHIMLLEDSRGGAQRESKLSKVAFLATCTFVSMFGGFALNLAVSGRRYRAAVKTKADSRNLEIPKEVVLEDPVLLATRALGWGSMYAVLGTGAIGFVAYYLVKT